MSSIFSTMTSVPLATISLRQKTHHIYFYTYTMFVWTIWWSHLYVKFSKCLILSWERIPVTPYVILFILKCKSKNGTTICKYIPVQEIIGRCRYYSSYRSDSHWFDLLLRKLFLCSILPFCRFPYPHPLAREFFPRLHEIWRIPLKFADFIIMESRYHPQTCNTTGRFPLLFKIGDFQFHP